MTDQETQTMVASPNNPRWTEAEYLAFERSSEERHEFIDGRVVRVSGAGRTHNVIVMNTFVSLHNQASDSPYFIYSSDIRTQIGKEHYTYPDIKIVYGQGIFVEDDDEADTLFNPTVIIEVLSHSTEAYNRGDKFIQYRTLESLQEYILISQKRVQIERYVRQPDKRWLLADDVRAVDDSIELTSIGCSLNTVDVYRKVEFENSPDSGTNTEG